ncbi:MAG: hypothetical protein OEW67_13790, partial [Cyclobacteriaceae bacterium]|nr:hypothetical protein [Cyclobacteriaceae bacterium]
MNKYTNTLSALALILGLSMASFTGYAQGMYASLNAGYNFASGAQTLAVNTTTTANSDISEAVNISLGKGINLSGA